MRRSDGRCGRISSGAKCRGIAGNAVLIPPSANGCLVKSPLTYSATTNGPVEIYGNGPKSQLIVGSTSGGISITDACGMSSKAIRLRDFEVTPGTASAPAFALHLSGVSGYGIDDVDVIGGTYGFTYGIQLTGAQQGYVHGGQSMNNGTGIYITDCTGGVGTVSSNGVDVGGGRTFADKTAAVDIEGGAADVWVHNVHITSSNYGVINDQTDGAGGYGRNYISQVHFEVNSTYGVDNRSGAVTYSDNNDYNTAAIHVSSGARIIADSNLIDGSVTLDANSSAVFTNNLMNGAFNDSTSASNIVQSNNTGNGRPLLTTIFNSSGQFTSASSTSGDILTLSPNSSVSGAWGETIKGAGIAQQVYLQLQDVALAGSTGGGTLSILSGVGGTQWAQFSSAGTNLAGLGTFANGFLSQASSTVVGNFTTTGNGSFGGNVGIGTTSPTANLGIQGSIGVNSSQLYLAANGNVGIGMKSSVVQPLDVNGNMRIEGNNGLVMGNSAYGISQSNSTTLQIGSGAGWTTGIDFVPSGVPNIGTRREGDVVSRQPTALRLPCLFLQAAGRSGDLSSDSPPRLSSVA